MVKKIEASIRGFILKLPIGTIVNVPMVKMLMGRTYAVGLNSNRLFGKALANLARQGYLSHLGTSKSYHGKGTTIQNWKVI